jgi:hypothetical protein
MRRLRPLWLGAVSAAGYHCAGHRFVRDRTRGAYGCGSAARHPRAYENNGTSAVSKRMTPANVEARGAPRVTIGAILKFESYHAA